MGLMGSEQGLSAQFPLFLRVGAGQRAEGRGSAGSRQKTAVEEMVNEVSG